MKKINGLTKEEVKLRIKENKVKENKLKDNN